MGSPAYLSKRVARVRRGRIIPEIKPEWVVAALIERNHPADPDPAN